MLFHFTHPPRRWWETSVGFFSAFPLSSTNYFLACFTASFAISVTTVTRITLIKPEKILGMILLLLLLVAVAATKVNLFGSAVPFERLSQPRDLR